MHDTFSVFCKADDLPKAEDLPKADGLPNGVTG
jgi:hypothetical protein